jgi:hypothetical protein
MINLTPTSESSPPTRRLVPAGRTIPTNRSCALRTPVRSSEDLRGSIASLVYAQKGGSFRASELATERLRPWL